AAKDTRARGRCRLVGDPTLRTLPFGSWRKEARPPPPPSNGARRKPPEEANAPMGPNRRRVDQARRPVPVDTAATVPSSSPRNTEPRPTSGAPHRESDANWKSHRLVPVVASKAYKPPRRSFA